MLRRLAIAVLLVATVAVVWAGVAQPSQPIATEPEACWFETRFPPRSYRMWFWIETDLLGRVCFPRGARIGRMEPHVE